MISHASSAVAAAIVRWRDRLVLRSARADVAAQAERVRALALLEMISNQSGDVIFAKDLEGRYLLFNPAAGRVFGLDPKAMIGSRADEVIAAVDAEMVRAADRQVLDTLETVTSEERRKTVDGQRDFLVIRGPLLDGSGAAIGLYGIARDMTERHDLQTRLREREAAFARSQIVARLGHVVVGPGGVIESYSDTLPAMLGLPREKMPHDIAEWLRSVHADDRAALREQAIDAGESSRRDIDYRIERDDGVAMVLRQTAIPFDAGARGPVDRWFVTLQDITAEHRAEAELKASHALFQAVKDSVRNQMAVLDRDGFILDVNEAWRDFARRSARVDVADAHDDVGTNYLDLSPPAASALRDSPTPRVRRGHRCRALRARRRSSSSSTEAHPADTQRWFAMTATPLVRRQRRRRRRPCRHHRAKAQRAELQRHRVHLEEPPVSVRPT